MASTSTPVANPSRVESSNLRSAPWLAVVLAAFAAVAYGSTLSLPFIGDDYVFLDRTRNASFTDLWSFGNADFGWYRPWSRELHFWTLQRLAGLNEVAYRALGLALWVVALCLYAEIVRRLASPRVAALATLGAASLALWGTPLLWISGSQDLWMLCFTMTSMLLFIDGRRWWAVLPFGLALISKETSAVLPALVVAYLVFVKRDRFTKALRQTAHFWVLVLAWLAVHPTLHTRLLSGEKTPEIVGRLPTVAVFAKTALSTVNLDALPHPQGIGWEEVLRVLASALILVVGAIVVTRHPRSDPLEIAGARRGALSRLALSWVAVGWFPLFLPSIGWHAYYGCLGTLGAWFALALWLQDRRRILVAALAFLSILRGAHANTLSWDWGNEWYQRRAGNMLSAIRGELDRQHPTLPPHSRVFLGHMPNNIGLIAGQSPALRVWYRDSTLQADFYSRYRLRPASAPPGNDYFFRFDSLRGMIEIKTGPEDVQQGMRYNSDWEKDHEKLAMLFVRSGDVRRAADEFEKLSILHHRPDAAGYAGVCWEVVGDTSRADSLIEAAGSRMRLSRPQLDQWMKRRRASFPTQRTTRLSDS